MPNTLGLEPRLAALLDRLHATSEEQMLQVRDYYRERAKAGPIDWRGLDPDAHRFFADKLVALDPIKAEYCHLLCRALGARRVVEIGTSFGVSTLYLASAVRANGGGVVIGVEHEPEKAAAARRYFADAGLADLIDLREGDLRETLKNLEGPIDFVLMDIWTEMARPAMELVGPRLRKGAVVIADNTTAFAEPYADFFAYINDPANHFTTLTLPFDGGLEMSVRTA